MSAKIWMIFLLFLGCKTTMNVPVPVVEDGGTATELTTAQEKAIIDVLSEFPNGSEISVAIVKGDNSIFYGLKRQNDTIRTIVNSQSVFEVGSITKVFTTHLLLNAMQEGLIKNLEEPIQEYCPYKIKGNPRITFMQLANHTSGLPNNISVSIFNTNRSNPYKSWDEEKLGKYLKEEVKIESIPGEKYAYSNVGMAVLANTICNLRSEKYEALLRKEIFKPLQMTSSTTKRESVQGLLVSGYNWKGKATENWDLAAFEGAGALLSTTEDLSSYIKWNFEALKSNLALMSRQTINVKKDLKLALGWYIVEGYTIEPFLWHNGGTGGYKSSMGINLSNNTGVVILTNIGATNNPKKGLIDKLCYNLMGAMEE